MLLALADTSLLWGHRLSEWCGHGPQLEEDIALTNTALDAIGQARSLYQLVASRSMQLTTEDKLAYFRDASEFQNVPLAEAENGDYAQTIVRSLMLSAWFVSTWSALEKSADASLATIAREAVKAARVAFRHATDWTIRFGDGTDESRRRVEAAIATLAPYTHSLLATEIEGTDREATHASWFAAINHVMSEATFSAWPAPIETTLDRSARVTLLAEMQSLAREHPEATW